MGLAATALAYLGCTVAVNARPDASGGADGPWNGSLRPGVVSVMTGGVPAVLVEPAAVRRRRVWSDPGGTMACEDRARVEYVTCPYPPGSGFVEPAAGYARLQWTTVHTDRRITRGGEPGPHQGGESCAQRDHQQQP